MQAPGSLNVPILTFAIDQSPVADHVVNDDQSAAARQLERPLEIVGNTLLVGIDEDELERAGSFSDQLLYRLARVAQTHFDRLGESGAGDIGPCHLSVLGIGFEGD